MRMAKKSETKEKTVKSEKVKIAAKKTVKKPAVKKTVRVVVLKEKKEISSDGDKKAGKKETTEPVVLPEPPPENAKVEVKVKEETGEEPEVKEVPDAGKTEEVQARPERYWEAVGRRKTAVSRVRLFTKGDKGIFVNGKPAGVYFQTPELLSIAEEALKKMKSLERFRAVIKASGGGLKAQAEAARHGLARALVKFNPDFRKRLRRAGFLTRDPRMKERKKFGLKKARRAPQWAKR